MREMTKSAVALAQEALTVGRAALPAYASKFSRHDYTLPQLFAVLAVRKFLGQDYRGMEVLLGEWSELRDAIGLTKVPDHSTLCLAEGKLADPAPGGRSTASWPPASAEPGRWACSTTRRRTRRSTPPAWRPGTPRPTSAGAAPRGVGSRTRPGPS